MKGYWIGILHAHLPFVKHPEYDYFLEEHWLFEALSESYIPLLMQFESLRNEGIDFRLTMTISPPLAEMFSDEQLMNKYAGYLKTKIELSKKEIKRVGETSEFFDVVTFYRDKYLKLEDYFLNKLNRRPIEGFKSFMQSGNLEIVTCAATHGFLPILSSNSKSVEVQIAVGVQTYEKQFGRKPRGIWLPECAYYEGLDKVLEKFGIEFFFMDAHGLIYAEPTPRYGVFAPIYSPNGVAAFGRDPESSKQVWSSKEGYPGDYNYRDFYRDIGYDLDLDYIKPYISPDGIRVFTGFKYHRITGDGDYKEIYNPTAASKKSFEHAENFHFNMDKQIEFLNRNMDRMPAIVSPYDAELFGHWWFEGPDFLYHFFKEMDKHKVIKPITPSEYLKIYPTNQVCRPNPSSWGDGGYYDVWLNRGNDWIYRHLNNMANDMERIAEEHKSESDPIKIRLLNQMVRELLLAQSSDWSFLMTTHTAVEYSTMRTKMHISNFNLLSNMLADNINRQSLNDIEKKDSIFKDIDFKIYL